MVQGLGQIVPGWYNIRGSEQSAFWYQERIFCVGQMGPGRAFRGQFSASSLISEGCDTHGFHGTLGI